MTGGIVVVGASLAGLRAAEMLRRLGYDGPLTIVGDEPHLPYDRPPLSKQVLGGTWTREQLTLPRSDGLDARWHLGTAAASVDLGARTVWLADGRSLPYDGLVIATGARARRWAGPPSDLPGGVVTLRTIDDALALGRALTGQKHLLVVGGGFLGNEVASAVRARGHHVTLVDRHRLPLQTAGGDVVGEFVADLHRRSGIDLELGARVARFTAGPSGTLSGATLTGGREVRADTAVLALGAEPNTDWLAGSGLLVERGLVCDASLRPLLADGTPAPDVVAAGDLVRWPHPLAERSLLGLGHWTNAVEQGEAAARALLEPERAEAFRPVPSFWSDLHGTQLRSAGLPHLGTPRLVEHDPDRRRLVVTYHRGEELVGAVTVNRTSRLSGYHRQLAEQLSTADIARSYA
jgi:NADPH-dependent 2,4-dienoyl-CoA reductase/sulfur reductase-like enzyme